jgi:hypothetical protein
MEFSHQFIHHVYFWLKDPADGGRLVEGLRTLLPIPGIKMAHIGIPASTDRDVIDASYDVSWVAVFDDKAAQDAYQEDPVHLAFASAYRGLWKKILVYDSVPV